MRYIVYYIIVLCLCSRCFFTTSQRNDIPSFPILLKDSTTIFNTENIPGGKPTVLVFFSPDCEHCQAEMTDIIQKMDSLKNTQFYFVTIDPIERIKVFNGYYNLPRFPNITLGQDFKFFLPGHYKDLVPPSAFVYDKNKELRAAFKGEFTASMLISIINQM